MLERQQLELLQLLKDDKHVNECTFNLFCEIAVTLRRQGHIRPSDTYCQQAQQFLIWLYGYVAKPGYEHIHNYNGTFYSLALPSWVVVHWAGRLWEYDSTYLDLQLAHEDLVQEMSLSIPLSTDTMYHGVRKLVDVLPDGQIFSWQQYYWGDGYALHQHNSSESYDVLEFDYRSQLTTAVLNVYFDRLSYGPDYARAERDAIKNFPDYDRFDVDYPDSY